MKRIIILLVMALNLNVFSQTREPKAHSFQYDSQTIQLKNHPDFNINEFVLNWHWGFGKKMTNALGFNVVHYNIDDMMRARPFYRNAVELDTLADSVHLIMNSSIVGYHWSKYSPAYSLSYQYEPTLYINPTNPLAFNPRAYDTTKPIFGFSNIRGFIPTLQSDPNYNRLIIRDSLNGQTILQNNWPNDYLETFLNSICHYNITFNLANSLLTTL